MNYYINSRHGAAEITSKQNFDMHVLASVKKNHNIIAYAMGLHLSENKEQ